MRGAALADLHLGFRTFNHTTDGRNTREVDVERAWEAAVNGILAEHARKPIAVVTIAGDLFNHPRVSDYAKLAFLRGIRRLLEAGIVVIVLQGNHDAGRTAEVLTPIMLADGLGENLYIVTEPERIRLRVPPAGKRFYEFVGEGRTVSVACFPFVTRGNGASYRLDPDPQADINILVVHAAVKGDIGGDRLPYFYGGEGALDIGHEADRWDVIAVGDYHEFTRLHPERLAFYSGSIERTSSDIWKEHAPKGWVLWDTDAGTMELREVPTRPMYDYDLDDVFGGAPIPRLDQPLDAALVNAALEQVAGVEEHVGAIVRLKVDDFPRAERDHIDWALVRELRARCAHFYLDLRYAGAAVTDLGDRRERKALTLADEAAAFFAEDPEDVRALALSYLDVEAAVEDVAEEVAP